MKIKFKINNKPNWGTSALYPVFINRGIDDDPKTLTVRIATQNKSILKVGNLIVYNTRRFNLFQRCMWKLFFGIEIENIKEN